MIFQSLVMILPPFFSTLKTITKSLGKIKKSEATCCSQEHAEQVCQISLRYTKLYTKSAVSESSIALAR